MDSHPLSPGPLYVFGYLPTFADAPANPDHHGLDWVADAFLVTVEHLRATCLRPVVGFRWGYRRPAGNRTELIAPSPAGAAEWSALATDVRRQYPERSTEPFAPLNPCTVRRHEVVTLRDLSSHCGRGGRARRHPVGELPSSAGSSAAALAGSGCPRTTVPFSHACGDRNVPCRGVIFVAMGIGDDRELFLLLCRGLLGTFCSHVDFEGARFGVTSSVVPSRGTGPGMVLHFSEAEFERAVVVTEEWAESLWPDRPPRRRAVQLMLVHVDEQIATTRGAPETYAMSLPDGEVSVQPWGDVSVAGVAAADEVAAVEQERVRRIVDEGRKKGHTFEWR